MNIVDEIRQLTASEERQRTVELHELARTFANSKKKMSDGDVSQLRDTLLRLQTDPADFAVLVEKYKEAKVRLAEAAEVEKASAEINRIEHAIAAEQDRWVAAELEHNKTLAALRDRLADVMRTQTLAINSQQWVLSFVAPTAQHQLAEIDRLIADASGRRSKLQGMLNPHSSVADWADGQSPTHAARIAAARSRAESMRDEHARSRDAARRAELTRSLAENEKLVRQIQAAVEADRKELAEVDRELAALQARREQVISKAITG